MASTPQIYGLNGAATYVGATGSLPGASAMSAGVLFNPILNTAGVLWDNLAGGAGWKIEYTLSGTSPNVINLVITIDATPTIVTVAAGSFLSHWMFASFTLNGTAMVVYLNGQAAYTVTLGTAITPSAGVPTLTTITSDAVAFAFYTESTLTAAEIAELFYELKAFGGVALPALITAIELDHVYCAAESQRLPSVTFADTGDTGGVNLTAATAASGIILPGDFGQAAGVTGATS